MRRIAVIGAGLSGLVLARRLAPHAEVTVFEKSRGVSGRLATRRIGKHEFDHGAQFFTARSQAFADFLAPFIHDGRVAEWQPQVLTLTAGEKPYRRDWFEPHYVGVPGMTALCKALAEGLDVRLEARVTRIEKSPVGAPRWTLYLDESPLPDTFDWVVSTAPLAQTRELLGGHLSPDALPEEGLAGVSMAPCYTLMLGFNDAPALNFDCAKVKHSAIGWIMANASMPGRSTPPTLVIQTTGDWAQAHLEDDDDAVSAYLLEELEGLLPLALPEITVQSLQRWRYSRVESPVPGQDFLLDMDNRLAAAGDWCVAGRVEGAFLSADSLAGQLEPLL